MTKYRQRFILWLIKRKIRKHERNAYRAWQAEAKIPAAKFNILNYMEDPQEYARLINLRRNIEGINSPWGGVFMPGWTRDAKLRPEFDNTWTRTEEVLPPLSEEEQWWADLDGNEFIAAINSERVMGLVRNGVPVKF